MKRLSDDDGAMQGIIFEDGARVSRTPPSLVKLARAAEDEMLKQGLLLSIARKRELAQLITEHPTDKPGDYQAVMALQVKRNEVQRAINVWVQALKQQMEE